MKTSFPTIAVAVLLAACSAEREPDSKTLDSPAQEAAVASAAQAGDEIRETYLRSCHSCHGPGVTGAPRTGDVAAWEPRASKGLKVLVANAINGYRAMPPKGLCFDCTEAEFAGLIRYMAGEALSDETAADSGEDTAAAAGN